MKKVIAAAVVCGVSWAMTGAWAQGREGNEKRGLLIVTGEGLGVPLAEFVEFKRARMSVEVVSLSEALKRNEGSDDAEKLKRELFSAWKERGVGYVLLVGDADVMPVRYMALDRVTKEAFDYAFYPSDLYYGDVAKQDGSFEDWNGNKEGFHGRYFGEVRGEKNKQDAMNFDGVDYRPELAVGRWPVSTGEEAKRVAEKTMGYERAVEAGKVKREAVMVLPPGWVDERARIGGWRWPEGWGVEKRFYKDGDGRFDTAAPTEGEVVKLLKGGASLVIHAGHGSEEVWEHCLSCGSIGKLGEQKTPAVMMSAGCTTARFATLPPYEGYVDEAGVVHKGTNGGEVFTGPPAAPGCYQRGVYNMTGLGERLVRAEGKGAVVYIGCNTGSQPCAVTLEEGFVEYLYGHPNARAGDCWKGAVAYYWEREGLATIKPTADWYPASIFFQGMKFMYFGDPSVPMAR